ncbi:MAG: M1 family metallopeptidase [Flavobacteriales bacterium]
MQRLLFPVLTAVLCFSVQAQDALRFGRDKFRQLDQELPTPNTYRTASGAPGHQYWQQKADHDIQVELDEEKRTITGIGTITYHNLSPDRLDYLWVQLDQNVRAKDSDASKIGTGTIGDSLSVQDLQRMVEPFDGGFRIDAVTDASGRPLRHTINGTMMRIDLPRPLAAGQSTTFKLAWWYPVQDRIKYGGRSGYEYFPEEDNCIFTIAQFFPRMAVYADYQGWQHKQFLGRGEFTLTFGDYKVAITVPADHVVAATGTLQNENAVLTAAQRARLARARTALSPVMIVTEEEARKAEQGKSTAKRTWSFSATNVRDFAFASSRKFIWDGMAQPVAGRNVLCMSFYPKEGNPLWEQYSTKVVAHTIRTYSKFTVDYPYPVAISVHTDHIGMEYPMICFNGGRPEVDGTYSERTKYGMIGVIIHEVGHNFFPMIINSDERQWTWMDEGLNSFVQYLTEQEWDHDFPSRRGPARKIVDYMKGDLSGIEPIMTNSESVTQLGNNAYGKPAAALNILRETVMGRELFDHAFKVYCERWKLKHPTPADFFRTMEDASAVDLDWFWRGWFYTTDHVDLAVERVRYLRMDPLDPQVSEKLAKADRDARVEDISVQRNRALKEGTVVMRDPTTRDFYNDHDPLNTDPEMVKAYEHLVVRLSEDERTALGKDLHFYEVTLENIGGLVMPVIIEWAFVDGTTEIERIPAEIWKTDDKVTKVFVKEKEVAAMLLDPYQETADTDLNNNAWPTRMMPSRFDIYKQREQPSNNPMRTKRGRGIGTEGP